MGQRQPCVDRANIATEERAVLVPRRIRGGFPESGVAKHALIERNRRSLTQIAPDCLDEPVLLIGVDELEQRARRLRGQDRAGLDMKLAQRVVEAWITRVRIKRNEPRTGLRHGRAAAVCQTRFECPIRVIDQRCHLRFWYQPAYEEAAVVK